MTFSKLEGGLFHLRNSADYGLTTGMKILSLRSFGHFLINYIRFGTIELVI